MSVHNFSFIAATCLGRVKAVQLKRTAFAPPYNAQLAMGTSSKSGTMNFPSIADTWKGALPMLGLIAQIQWLA
jgi:hypothetical protein